MWGYLILIPWALLCWLCAKAINYSVGGGTRRIVGILTCPLLGGAMIGMGYWAAFIGWKEWVLEGDYLVLHKNTIPIAGWISLVTGGLITIVGPIWSAVGKEEVEWGTEDWSAVGKTIYDEDPIDLKIASMERFADIRCPKCGSEMVMRTSKKGTKAGHIFHVCIYYPECKGKMPIKE